MDGVAFRINVAATGNKHFQAHTGTFAIVAIDFALLPKTLVLLQSLGKTFTLLTFFCIFDALAACTPQTTISGHVKPVLFFSLTQ